MEHMSEISDIEFSTTVFSWKEVLVKFGIDLPEKPDPTRSTPREYLFRVDSIEHLLKEKMEPTSGKLGTYGVYLGDCREPLPSAVDVLCIFPNTVSQSYVVDPSERFIGLMEAYSEKKGLDLTSISDGIEAMEAVYRKFAVYENRTGIVTYPEALDLTRASHILVSGVLDESLLFKIPNILHKKIIRTDFSGWRTS